MADREYKYYAFLSLSAQDNGETPADSSVAVRRRWGNWLDDALKTFSIPPEFVGQINGRGEIIPERIAPVFVDQSELPGDSPLSPEIRQALEESLCLIVVCSPHSAQSRQVNEVVRYFKQLGRANWILPFVVAGEPNPDPAKNGEPFPADECFVPALRHPVQLDGTLDTGRRAGRHLFVDARYGATKHEILAQDDRHAEADLEMAKIQLISLLVGVGFNGLWQREQERHFFDLAEARSRAREALDEVEKIRCQLQEAQRQADEAGKQSQALQNLPHDLQGQIQETQNQALTARNQARAAEQQLQEFQNKIRETEAQLEVARSRASAAESKVLETQQQARETQNQLEAGLIQAFAAQKEALAIQNRTQEGQIQDVQNQLLKAQLETQDLQSQLAEVRRQAQDAQEKLSAAQNIVQEFQDQLQLAKSQLEEARLQVREAEDKSAMLQVQARVAQKEALESLSREQESRNQDAQNQILKAQLETQNVQSQLEEVRRQARDAQDKLLATQNTVQEFQGRLQLALGQLEEARLQVREAENQSSAAQVQTRQAQDQVQEIQSQARDTESQFAAAQIQVQKILHQRQNARRLTRAFAVLAVLASLAAAVVARNAWHQRQTDNQALATADAEASGTFDLTSVAESSLRQALQKVGGAEQSENRRRSLDRLAVLVPLGEIPGDLKAAAIIADAQQRSHFQKWLLIRLGWVNPVAAMTNASAIEGMIVNDDGAADSNLYFQLAVLDNWTRTDWAGAFNWVCQLADTDSRQRALDTLIRTVQSEPDSESRYQSLADGIGELAKSDLSGALTLAESLPGGVRRDTILASLWMKAETFTVSEWIYSLVVPPEIMASPKAAWPWAKPFWNANFDRPALLPASTGMLTMTTNGPVQVQLPE